MNHRTLYNFRGEATRAHQEYLVQVSLKFIDILRAEKLLVAHDSRPASVQVARALFNSLPKSPDYLFIGLCSTPAIAYVCRKNTCPAVVVTASHEHWIKTGLKLFDSNGLPISPSEENKLRKLCERDNSFLSFSTLSTQEPLICIPENLAQYFEQLEKRALGLQTNKTLVEVGSNWVATIQEELPGIRVEGSHRTDPSASQPSDLAREMDTLIRVDEDLDKLIMWELGQEIPGQFLLANWISLRPKGQVCVSFDTTMFVQSHLKKLGYDITTCPVGDQFVANKMHSLQINTGGEPNGHFIAGERSYCPDAIASAFDILENGKMDHSWWALSKDAFYCRGIISPYKHTIKDTLRKLKSMKYLKNYNFSYRTEENAIVISSYPAHRVIFRISQFENVAVLQTEGIHAKTIFDEISSYLSTELISRKEEWTKLQNGAYVPTRSI